MTEQERRIYAKYNLDLAKLPNPEAAALHQIRRLAGLDPDGRLVPMQPYITIAQKFNDMTAESRKHVRDHYLVQALRFT